MIYMRALNDGNEISTLARRDASALSRWGRSVLAPDALAPEEVEKEEEEEDWLPEELFRLAGPPLHPPPSRERDLY